MQTGDSLFQILGPVMVGPSSSHTAGAVRLGLMARQIAGAPIQKASLTLYNSFAKTYRGHGTDKGLISGLLGFNVQDERIPEAEKHLAESDMSVDFKLYTERNSLSPNTVRFDLELENGEGLSILGHSAGGGKIYISKIKDFPVSLQGDYPTLLMVYQDQPGMIWQATKVIAEAGVNIATLSCNRMQRGEIAYMSIALDQPLQAGTLNDLEKIADVHFLRMVDALEGI